PAGVVKAERDEHDAPVVVASVQTAYRPDRLARLGTDFNTVIVDEAHHATATTYQTILDHVRAGESSLLLGVTATPYRSDGTGLGMIFGEIVYQRSILDMVGR